MSTRVLRSQNPQLGRHTQSLTCICRESSIWNACHAIGVSPSRLAHTGLGSQTIGLLAADTKTLTNDEAWRIRNLGGLLDRTVHFLTVFIWRSSSFIERDKVVTPDQMGPNGSHSIGFTDSADCSLAIKMMTMAL